MEKNKKTILIVDNDDDLKQTLVEQLSFYNEFHVIHAETTLKTVQMARSGAVDLLILGTHISEITSEECIKILRKADFRSPIIVIAGNGQEAEKIPSLEAGANDYLTKPIRFSDVLMRIRAQLRQIENGDNVSLSIGPYTFKPGQKIMVDKKGEKLRLTEKETAIIKYLYKASSRVITRDVLLNEVWGYNSGVTTHTLETHIYRLRQKIERDPSNAKIVVTENGGYKLVP